MIVIFASDKTTFTPWKKDLDDMLHDLPVIEHMAQLSSQLRLEYEVSCISVALQELYFMFLFAFNSVRPNFFHFVVYRHFWSLLNVKIWNDNRNLFFGISNIHRPICEPEFAD